MSSEFQHPRWERGRLFRVAREGAVLHWQTPCGPMAWMGSSAPLPLDTEVRCQGVVWGWGADPGIEAMFAVVMDGERRVGTITPAEPGHWFAQYPRPDLLVEVQDDQGRT